ncbi:hypothetical protein [Undibacterium curvum]|uniref:Uncharacterized protein n=1 Tax=Undibacterium curvum TaxID=2762294 RepID=A0ABR7A763_9BURK|nr:hypothetical protein [Undibacterium curvum]MBC3932692.1 hypothetical protein [Undibacterium curvum]
MQVFPSQFEPRFPAQRQLPALLLVLAIHMVFWQAWQHQRQQHQTEAQTVRYLDLFQVTPAKPATNTVKEALPPSKVPRTTPAIRSKPVNKSQALTEPTTDAKAETRPAFPLITETEPVPAQSHAETSSTSNSSSPGIDQLRKSGLQIDKEIQKSTIAQIQASHLRIDTLETELAKGTKKAERKDCRKAFAGLGLLGLVPLAASTVTDLGCKW